MTTARCRLLAAAVPALLLTATSAQAFFVDGDGHYGLRGETQSKPGFSDKTGTYQAIEQSFRLKGEARVNDQSSFFLEFNLFPDPRGAYMGDKSDARVCKENNKSNNSYETRPCDYPDSGEPRYKPYVPQITKAYVRYAFDYCIVEAGRRGRDWGLGIFLDSGTKPFSTDASVFDGVTCDINIQKTQTLGLSVGYDKLAETGADPDPNIIRTFGPADAGDDLDQFFLTIQYDDRKANAGAAFTKQLGVYFAQVSSRKLGKDGGSSTDIKYLDLYTGLFFSDLSFRNELLFRMGKSGDPNWQNYGGATIEDRVPAINKVQSIGGIAGEIDWTISRSGAAIGPADYNKGDASRHAVFFDYAYAPGDKEGDGYRAPMNRDTNVTAMAFHRNYKPALLLFNQHQQQDDMIVDGQFNPSRVENASVFALGYRYESMAIGNFDVKFITASLNSGISKEGKDDADAKALANVQAIPLDNQQGRARALNARPAGYFGTSLGYELDLSYTYKVGREADLGIATGAALPGDAWKIDKDAKPSNNFLVQTFAAFHF